MKKIASLLLVPAIVLGHGAAKAADSSATPLAVSYSVTLLDGGKPTATRLAVGMTGSVLTMGSATAEEAVTACKFHGKGTDSTFNNNLSVGDSVDLTILPAAVDEGRVDALISATVGHGEKRGTATVGGCTLTKGIAHEDAVTDEATLKVGESKSIDLGAGKTLVIKREKI